ncbi:uncharacterized protein (DUF427 family) [Inhella inkyongensis]|uniref:Uncharacterized protein (DUF427 family) n=1 Tax=Inhella inkyongensis TaxID=392593 RepID=A0A840S6D9_9BURK|nr:DUF427 domain-containing protein [Inhella inkyongensis]MBB5204040.1 uncharacterized protein (DUF427 family) [Inhella inkyongensis]
MKAIWKGTVIADSPHTVVMDGNHYFPAASLKRELTTFSNHRSRNAYGEEQWLSLFVNGDLLPDAVWFYPAPTELGAALKDHVAFVQAVQISD